MTVVHRVAAGTGIDGADPGNQRGRELGGPDRLQHDVAQLGVGFIGLDYRRLVLAGRPQVAGDSPFQVGTTFTMTPPGDDPVSMRLTEVVPGELFTDEVDAGDFVVRTVHRLTPEAADAAFFAATPDLPALVRLLRPRA